MTTQKASIPLDDLSLEELVTLNNDVEKQISKMQRANKNDVLKQMNEMAKNAGFDSAADLVANTTSRKPRADKGVKLPPKYQNPDDESKTWSGKGRAPQWILDYERKRGKKRDDLLIEQVGF